MILVLYKISKPLLFRSNAYSIVNIFLVNTCWTICLTFTKHLLCIKYHIRWYTARTRPRVFITLDIQRWLSYCPNQDLRAEGNLRNPATIVYWILSLYRTLSAKWNLIMALLVAILQSNWEGKEAFHVKTKKARTNHPDWLLASL